MTDRVATERERVVYKKLKSGESVPKRRETVRTGWCPDHKSRGGYAKQSSNFVGTNEHGWIFGCTKDGRGDISHYFVNKAPDGET